MALSNWPASSMHPMVLLPYQFGLRVTRFWVRGALINEPPASGVGALVLGQSCVIGCVSLIGCAGAVVSALASGTAFSSGAICWGAVSASVLISGVMTGKVELEPCCRAGVCSSSES